ncbi:glycosyltransferase involved in cell wall biosynthesis [Leeuwenhoekiella aestuarii]|nr:glycosyltransferase involved in cell wall biosynthesis [Leeuwenhoekiella aestuarii]
MAQTHLSLIIPTYNEERFIKQAIQCSQFADEVIIIDSYSTDTTTQIVKELGCKLIQRKFDNFSSQKNHAISETTNDWIFILDADEYISPRLQSEILDTINSAKHNAYRIYRRNFFVNRFLKYGSDGNDSAIRLFNKNYCWYEGLVHERVIVNGSLGKLKILMQHYTWVNLRNFLIKKNSYAALQAQQILEKGKEVSYLILIIKPLGRFISEYLIRGGFLDGIAGIISTRMNSYGVISRYLKLRNLQRMTTDKRLLHYDIFTLKLNEEAAKESKNRPKTGLLKIYLLPKLVFINYYFFKGYFFKGMDGYALSYLYSFKEFQSLICKWFRDRGVN